MWLLHFWPWHGNQPHHLVAHSRLQFFLYVLWNQTHTSLHGSSSLYISLVVNHIKTHPVPGSLGLSVCYAQCIWIAKWMNDLLLLLWLLLLLLEIRFPYTVEPGRERHLWLSMCLRLPWIWTLPCCFLFFRGCHSWPPDRPLCHWGHPELRSAELETPWPAWSRGHYVFCRKGKTPALSPMLPPINF